MLLPRVNPSYLDDVPVPKHTLDDYRPVCDADVPDADVVVATWWETAEWVVRLSPAKGAKAFFLQGFEVYGAQPAERVRRTWSFPMHKIVIAQWLADVARREFNDDWVTVVPNSVDTRQFDAPVRGKQRTPTVGYLYSSVACKGCDRVIEAVRAARRALPALDVLAFGASSESEPPGLPEGCRYHRSPKQTELAAIYAACDAWLFASMAEGFGLPILEAMACRTPVIGTPAGAAPELIGMGGGIPLESFSPDEMAYAIVKIARMPDEEWRRMSACAYATARGYSWDDATDRFEVALKRAMTGRPAGLMDGVGA
jgi:glycosyltransferase involved in cell wall biosynthesis